MDSKDKNIVPPLEAFDKESAIQRNPHSDFESVQASRASYNHAQTWHYLKSPNPTWKIGDGANEDDWKKHGKISIDPKDPKRTCMYYVWSFGYFDADSFDS